MHLLEINTSIAALFDRLKDKLTPTVTIYISPTWKREPIDENSTIGEQIKHYRRLANLKQTELAERVGCTKYEVQHIENKDIKLANIDLIKAIIKELNIEDRLNFNDDYLAFILNNPGKAILDFRKKNNIKRVELSKMIGSDISVIKRWENGKSIISRKCFNKLKQCMG